MVANQMKILVIDDDPALRDACREILRRQGHHVELAEGGRGGLALLGKFAFDVIMLDLRMPDIDGMTVLRRIIEQDPHAVVIIISGHGSIERAVEAMKLGAFDFVSKPFTPDRLRGAVEKAREKRQLILENAYLKDEIKRRSPTRMIYRSAAIEKIMDLARRVAMSDATVLLTGQSGTGKGILARIIHELSARRSSPFVAVDCSTLVPTLFESELFGHVKGSFTGADADKMGKFELSDGGTLFFDEVANISWEIQAKLLKAVEDRAVCRVGSNRLISVDTRLVAATNQNLAQAVQAGTFRQDLFYRLNVVHIELPPLKDRPEDVPVLAEYFLDRYRYRSPSRVRGFAPQAMEALARQPWPGNVRELENAVQRLAVLAGGELITLADIEAGSPAAVHSGADDGELLSLAELEKRQIIRAMNRLAGHRGEMAKALGIDRKTLRLKIRKYGLEDQGPDAD
ncbi:two component, sigma54 specific, transcriptional regulator, Fis family [Desulfarculus baarsii DSM 2075]|uniref:Two component, sigma54 specific, transcriptional regulator, Fis family n=1 Tax=Desulfarculus baarsii (strain ATCC 33931 / DSM 2075 / LMG 7858 / VKM B-1802 / 2st14) TaxID=644282 RepID=E1QF79_DESB2|nr:two component, sigma54 specific, transcriptional regulator, Fis family [Desulfarculus baarsii DSM 2075]